jgi:NADPH:quinone reductase-like Zn-dependent oxidoreductase
VLLESTSVVAKACEHVERIGGRACYVPEVALITGAGPVGLLAAMLARQRGLDTWVLDIVTGGPKPQLIADLGATSCEQEAGQRADVASSRARSAALMPASLPPIATRCMRAPFG